MLTKNIKEMLEETEKHIAMDAVVQGHYWHLNPNDTGISQPTGCFIGCLTHGSVALNVTAKYGIPEQLVEELEKIFEGLPPNEIQEFFRDVSKAIESDGKDLSGVIPEYYAELEARAYNTHKLNLNAQAFYERNLSAYSERAAELVFEKVVENEDYREIAENAQVDEVQEQASSILDLMRDAPVML
jgi:hypothetical protein